MNRKFYFLLCTFFVLGWSQAKADRPPSFVEGRIQNLTVCENSGVTSINTLLAITDSNPGELETWSAVTDPVHGSLIAGVSAASTGGILTPSDVTYTPATGFSGADSFTVRVTDGVYSDTTTIHVLINPLPPFITGSANICNGATTTLTEVGIGTWSTTGTMATINPTSGVVTALETGDPTITYTYPTGCKTTLVITVNPVPDPIAGTFSVCSGLIAGLDDVGGGSWSSANTAVAMINPGTGYYTGVSAGNSVVTYTLSDGCSSVASITINPTPALTGPATACQGAELALSGSLSGGLWSSSNPSIATVSSGYVTTVSAGSVTITYILGSCMSTHSILINPEAPITGVATVCNGATSLLANSVPGGLWSSATPGVATINASGVVTSVSPGTTLITYAHTSGCFTTVVFTVNLIPLPITGVSEVCRGATTALGDPDAGGSWSSSITAIATVNAATGVVTALLTGVPVITYMLSTGCEATVRVTVNPLPDPIGGIFSVCAGFEVSMLDGGGGVWSSGNTTIATINATTGYVTGVLPGTSVLTYSFPTGCSAIATVTVNASPVTIAGPANVCQGDSIVLTDAVGPGAWSTTSAVVTLTASTGTVIGDASGVATIMYSVGACSTSKVITVNPINPVLGPSSVCDGLTASVADVTVGGTWSSSTTTIAMITPATGVITGFAPGSVIITYTMSTGCFATRSFTVNPMPDAIIGPPFVCVDSSFTFSDSTIGGLWAVSSPSIATVNVLSGTLSAFATGEPTITYTLGTGCAVTARFTVNPLPDAISAPGTVCAASTVSCYDEGGGAWTTNNTLIATVNAGTGHLTGVSAGISVITYTLNGCAAVKNITVNPLPTAITGDSMVCANINDTLGDSGGGTWTSGNETVANIDPSTGVVYGHVTGTAAITYTLPATGCYATEEITVAVCNEGVKSLSNAESAINVLPNPSNGAFIIRGSLNVPGDAIVSVSISDILGQVIYSDKLIAVNGKLNHEVNLTNALSNGMYLLNLRSAGTDNVFRLLVNH